LAIFAIIVDLKTENGGRDLLPGKTYAYSADWFAVTKRCQEPFRTKGS